MHQTTSFVLIAMEWSNCPLFPEGHSSSARCAKKSSSMRENTVRGRPQFCSIRALQVPDSKCWVGLASWWGSLLAMPVVGMYLLIGGAFHAYNVSTWPVEEVEVLATRPRYDSYWVPEDGEYHESQENGMNIQANEDTCRRLLEECGDVLRFQNTCGIQNMEEHPVGTFIDMRVNPERTDPMYEVEQMPCDQETRQKKIPSFTHGCFFEYIIVLAGIAKQRRKCCHVRSGDTSPATHGEGAELVDYLTCRRRTGRCPCRRLSSSSASACSACGCRPCPSSSSVSGSTDR